jgi:hypothetical protein
LKDIELEINKLNIFIGEQATGKSLIAKLVQYFQQIHENIMTEFVKLTNEPLYYTKRINDLKLLDKDKLLKIVKLRLLKLFTEKFPVGLVSNSQEKTEVVYVFNKNLKVTINLTMEGYVIFFQKIIEEKIYQLYCEYIELSNKNIEIQKYKDENEKLSFKLSSVFFPEQFRKEIFISEERGNHLKIERYSDKKNTIIENSIEYRAGGGGYFNKNYDFNEILKGNVEFDIDDNYNSRIFLSNNKQDKLLVEFFSSGQKALVAFPIVFSTINDTYSGRKLNVKIALFIEEPEVHIFPSSQKEFTEILSKFCNNSYNNISSVFITTHSPYILTSFNNLIQADNTYKIIEEQKNKLKEELDKELKKIENEYSLKIKELDAFMELLYESEKEEQIKEVTKQYESNPEKLKNEELEKKLFKIIPKEKHISFEDVSAYYLENGKMTNIMNSEYRNIDAEKIDEVSNTILNEFNQLLELEIDIEKNK